MTYAMPTVMNQSTDAVFKFKSNEILKVVLSLKLKQSYFP